MAKVEMAPTCEFSDATGRMTMLVDYGASGYYFDDERHPRLKYILLNYKGTEEISHDRYRRTTLLLEIDTDTVSGAIVDDKGNRHQVDLPGIVVPGLGHRLFSPSQALKTGLATITASRHRSEQG